MKLYGDWNSKEARLIDMALTRCQGHSYCQTDDEITKWLKNKFLLVMYNRIRFDSNLQGKEAFVHESVLDWIIINTQSIVTIPYKLITSEARLQD